MEGDAFTRPRVAVAVRAGDEVLGSIWAAVPGPLSEERTEALCDAAKLVALHLLRVRAGADVQRRLRADLLSTALEGGVRAREALDRLGLGGQPLMVLGVAVTGSDVGEGADDDAVVAHERRAAQRRVRHAPQRRPPRVGRRAGRRRGLRAGAGARAGRRRRGARRADRPASSSTGSATGAAPWSASARSPATSPRSRTLAPCADRALRVLRDRPRRTAAWRGWPTSTSRRCCSSCATWSPRAATGRAARSRG